MEKVTKKTTVVGFADALQQSLNIIAKRMNEQRVQINTLHIQIDNVQRELDELKEKSSTTLIIKKEPNLFDK